MRIVIKILMGVVGAILLPICIHYISDGHITSKPEMLVPSYILFGVFGAIFGWLLSVIFFEPIAALRGALLFGLIGLAVSFILPGPGIIWIVMGALLGAGYAGHMVHGFRKILKDDN